jgi:hypothetical protein
MALIITRPIRYMISLECFLSMYYYIYFLRFLGICMIFEIFRGSGGRICIFIISQLSEFYYTEAHLLEPMVILIG